MTIEEKERECEVLLVMREIVSFRLDTMQIRHSKSFVFTSSANKWGCDVSDYLQKDLRLVCNSGSRMGCLKGTGVDSRINFNRTGLQNKMLELFRDLAFFFKPQKPSHNELSFIVSCILNRLQQQPSTANPHSSGRLIYFSSYPITYLSSSWTSNLWPTFGFSVKTDVFPCRKTS